MLIQETKLDNESLTNFNRKLGFMEVFGAPTDGASGGLAIIADPRKIIYTPTSINKHWMCGSIKSLKSNLKYNILNINGPTSYLDRRLIWKEINTFLNVVLDQTFIISCDFNTILDPSDKLGGKC